MNQKKISQEYEKAIQYIYELMKSGELTIGNQEAVECAEQGGSRNDEKQRAPHRKAPYIVSNAANDRAAHSHCTDGKIDSPGGNDKGHSQRHTDNVIGALN